MIVFQKKVVKFDAPPALQNPEPSSETLPHRAVAEQDPESPTVTMRERTERRKGMLMRSRAKAVATGSSSLNPASHEPAQTSIEEVYELPVKVKMELHTGLNKSDLPSMVSNHDGCATSASRSTTDQPSATSTTGVKPAQITLSPASADYSSTPSPARRSLSPVPISQTRFHRSRLEAQPAKNEDSSLVRPTSKAYDSPHKSAHGSIPSLSGPCERSIRDISGATLYESETSPSVLDLPVTQLIDKVTSQVITDKVSTKVKPETEDLFDIHRLPDERNPFSPTYHYNVEGRNLGPNPSGRKSFQAGDDLPFSVQETSPEEAVPQVDDAMEKHPGASADNPFASMSPDSVAKLPSYTSTTSTTDTPSRHSPGPLRTNKPS
jgi:hypothetical protein